MRVTLLLAALAVLIGALNAPAAAQVYVSQSGDNTTGDSWSSALFSVYEGVDLALSLGEDLWIAEGRYFLSSETTLTTGISIYGGFPDTGSADLNDRDPDAHPTILDASPAGSNIFHFVETEGGGVYGLTFTGCRHTRHASSRGMGVYLTSATNLKVKNCVFRSNLSAGFSANVYMEEGSSAVVEDCSFYNNTADNNGPCIYAYRCESLALSNCIFRNNVASREAGAVFVMETSVVVDSCEFRNNFSENLGVLHIHKCPDAVVQNCLFAGNRAVEGGGAVFYGGSSILVANNTFVDNYATRGGGVYLRSTSGARVVNCVFDRNLPHGGFSLSEAALDDNVIENCVFGTNVQGVWGREEGGQTTEYVTVLSLNASSSASGNISGDPGFVAPQHENYHLGSDSSCKGIGASADAPNKDFEGDPRPVDAIDVGYDQYTDGDGDGMQDAWETEFNLDPAVPDGGQDADEDGLDNEQEYLRRTNPQAPAPQYPPLPAVYVSLNGNNSTGDSWATALHSLPDAVVRARQSNGIIWIAEGEYAVNDTIEMSHALELYGGFPVGMEAAGVDRDPEAYPSVLKAGDETGVLLKYHGVQGGVLDGLKITGGGTGPSYYTGGAVAVNSTFNLRIRNSTFEANRTSEEQGGAAVGGANCGVYIENCRFLRNSSHEGAAVYMYKTRYCLINDSDFIDNAARDLGGAVNINGTHAEIRKSTFVNNRSYGWGSYIEEKAGAIVIRGGALSVIANCLFVGNSADKGGGGVMYYGNKHAYLYGCSFYGNQAPVGSAIDFRKAEQVHVANCILAAGNSPAVWEEEPSDWRIEYCLFDGNTGGVFQTPAGDVIPWADGPNSLNAVFAKARFNIDGNAGFVGPEHGNFRLGLDSDGLDMGADSGIALARTDYENDGRVAGQVDIGHDEYMDADGDGMQDAWEIAVGLNPLIPNAGEDDDGDGVSNYDEYRAMTDPHDDQSPPPVPVSGVAFALIAACILALHFHIARNASLNRKRIGFWSSETTRKGN